MTPMPKEGRMPPQNIEAEQAVLAAMLIDKKAIARVQEILSDQDFYRETHRLVYETMLELNEKQIEVDIVTLTDGLQKKGILEKVGGLTFVAQLGDTIPTAANIAFHANIVREKAELRRLIDVATEISSKAYEEQEEVADLMDEAEKKILAVAARKSTQEFTPLKTILLETIRQAEENYERKGGITGLETKFKDLDTMTAGLQKSDLILVAARPAMGKTAFTLNIAANVAKQNAVVAFFSLEMSKEQLVQRILCSEGSIDSQRLRRGQLETTEEWEQLIGAADRLSRTPLFIDDTPAITVMELRAKARRLKAEKGRLDLIIIDYLQLMSGRARKNNDGRQQEVSEISRSLKALARELSVPVIALSQLSRTVESRNIKKPMLSDLRESGSLEQDADIVMFLYREDYYDPDTENKNITNVIIAKHRNGPVGEVDLLFQKEFTRFQNLLRQ